MLSGRLLVLDDMVSSSAMSGGGLVANNCRVCVGTCGHNNNHNIGKQNETVAISYTPYRKQLKEAETMTVLKYNA